MSNEHDCHTLPSPCVSPTAPPSFLDVADRICDLYITSRERFVIMRPDAVFIPKTQDGPIKLRNRHVCHHLNQRYSISVFAGSQSSKFVCFDVDDGNRESVRTIISLIEQFGIPREYVYVSTSGGKGFHVEVFFDDIVYTKNLAILYDYVILNGQLNPQKIEFRPTHTQAIKLPLSKHYKTGNVCWFLNPETFEPYPYLEYVFEIKKCPRELFLDALSRCSMRKPITSVNDEDGLEQYLYPDAPKPRELSPDMEALIGSSIFPRITAPGQRHHLMRSIAIYNRAHGMTQDASLEALEQWWREQDKELTDTSESEAMSDAASLVAWTFSDGFVIPHRQRTFTIDEAAPEESPLISFGQRFEAIFEVLSAKHI